jgi:hypothetical protein
VTQLDFWLKRDIDDWWIGAVGARTMASLDRLHEVASGPTAKPRVLVLHLPVPHPPYVFDGACNARPHDRFTFQGIDPSGADAPRMAAIAGEQTKCVDHLMLNALSGVVAADPQAIVILISDHGPDVRLNWSNPTDPGLHDRVSNLVAARTPGHPHLFSDSITLVNVLPQLFNAYFGTALPTHDDDVFVEDPARQNALRRVAAACIPQAAPGAIC